MTAASANGTGTPFWPIEAAEITRIVGGSLSGDARAIARRCTTDTRAGVRVSDLFVGIVGSNFDGSRFASRALSQGASVAIVEPGHAVAPGPDQAVITVPSSLAALQQLAGVARGRFGGRVVAITGSNGKTAVKDLLAAALGQRRRVSTSPLSYNSQVGVALSLLQLDPAAEIALVECGISHPGEMARLAAIVKPDVGIFTNVGDAHLEGLGDHLTTAREKARLFASLPSDGYVVVPDDQRLAVEALAAQGTPMLLLGAGSSSARWDGTSLAVDGGTPLAITLGDGASADVWREDAAIAATLALRLGATPEQIAAGFADWRPAPMRLEVSVTPRGVTLVNDAYSADPESVDAALRLLAAEGDAGRAIAVLGGMAQLGQARQRAHAQVGERVVNARVHTLIGVGLGGAEIVAAAVRAGLPKERAFAVPDVAAAASLLDEIVRRGDRVLLKGSRPERLERLVASLFDALAPARLTVDLDVLVANFFAIQRHVGSHVSVAPVVKSFGYGIDGVRLARALERAGASMLVVAYPDEGVALRDAGVTVPILVQNTLAAEGDKLVRHGLTAQVSTLVQLSQLAAEAQRQQRALRVHVKVDSGMGRAGARPEAVVALCQAVLRDQWLVFDGLMTHFAAADDPAYDDFTLAQIRCFDRAIGALSAVGITPRLVHACNSAGIARFPTAHYNMVRVGLALLGYAEVDGAPLLGAAPVLRLVTHVVSVKEVREGEFVGYGLTWRAASDTQVAVIALGYGDGLPWSLSNRGVVSVQGHECPVVGRVCMDVTMIDVSGVPGGVVAGEEVVIFGNETGEPSLVELARRAGTIPYELLTRLSARVRRIFVASA